MPGREDVVVLTATNEAVVEVAPNTIWLRERTEEPDDGLALVSGEDSQSEPETS
jgi:hypothetical protein